MYRFLTLIYLFITSFFSFSKENEPPSIRVKLPYSIITHNNLNTNIYISKDTILKDTVSNKSKPDNKHNDNFSASFSIGAGRNHGGLGLKLSFGSEGFTGITLGLGVFESVLQWQAGLSSRVKYFYTIASFGTCGTSIVTGYAGSAKEPIYGFTIEPGFIFCFGKLDTFFLSAGVDITYFRKKNYSRNANSLDDNTITWDIGFGLDVGLGCRF